MAANGSSGKNFDVLKQQKSGLNAPLETVWLCWKIMNNLKDWKSID